MITAVALCPHPPLLLRELGGAADPVADLRAAAVAAVRAVTAGADSVVVVGPADAAGDWDPATPADVRRFGTTAAPTRSGLPLSLAVGARLLAEAGWGGRVVLRATGWDASADELEHLASALREGDRRTALLVLGDGSARRGEKAPGYLDDRAFPFDDALAKALADGDAVALRDLDADLARDLMVLGRTPLRLLGTVAAGSAGAGAVDADLTYRDDPFGVTYLVATWRLPA